HAAQARLARAIRKLVQIRGLQTSEQVLLEAESSSALTVRAMTADCGGKLSALGSPLYSHSKGFAPTQYGLGVPARASQKQVANVAQRGGMCAVMIGRASKRVAGL